MNFNSHQETGNPVRAEANWPPVVVGGAYQTGLNLMRDLLSHGVRAVAVDYDPTHQGFRSIYGKTYHCPDPDSKGEEWLAFMKALALELGQKPVFIATADIFVMALGRYASQLSGHYLNSPDAARLQAELSSKETQYALCAEHGFPCPRFAYVQNESEFDRFVSLARFPCLIKPLSEREWSSLPDKNPASNKKIVIAETEEELRGVYRSVAPYQPKAILQEVIAGTGAQKRVYLSVYGARGTLLGHCLMKQARSVPTYTSVPLVQPVQDERLLWICKEFLTKVSYRGVCEFEIKLDERDGQPMLVEINPRVSVTSDAAKLSGIPVGWLHYLDMIGFPVSAMEEAGSSFSHACVLREASDSFPYLLNGALTWREFIGPYRNRIAYFDFDWKDRRIAWVTARTSARYLVGAVLRHLRGKSKFA